MSTTVNTNQSRNSAYFIALSAVCALAIGCVTADASDFIDDPAAERAQIDDAKQGSDTLAAAIGQPVFYESNEDGEVVGGPIPDLLPESDVFKNAGSRPIHVQKYGPFGNGGTLGTGFPTSDWVAVVVGMDTTDGDINEVGTGNPLRAFPFQSNGIWHVTFDLRSHRDNESWSIWIMYIRRDMASTTNF